MDWEFDILYAIQSIRTPFLDKLMAFLSTIGNAGALWIVIGVVLCISKKYRRGGMQMLSAELLSFLDVWNMIEQPMTFLKTKALWPLSLFLPQIGLEDAGVGFAAAFAMLIPALLLFLAGQEYLEQGITAAALKG